MSRASEKLRTQILEMSDNEDHKAFLLSKELGNLKKQGFVTKDQGIKILKWKSPRPLQYYQLNTDHDFKEITGLAFSAQHEKAKMQVLTALSGVNYPAASAILMFYDNINYPVIDIRVWSQLHKTKLVKTNPSGQGFNLNEWIKYLDVIRGLASQLSLSARQVEYRLFRINKIEQTKQKRKLYS